MRVARGFGLNKWFWCIPSREINRGLKIPAIAGQGFYSGGEFVGISLKLGQATTSHCSSDTSARNDTSGRLPGQNLAL